MVTLKADIDARVQLSATEIQGDLIQPGHSLFGIVWANKDRMSGTPCFAGTRVPVQSLFDYLEAGDSIDVFTKAFPPVTKSQVTAVLELSQASLLDGLIIK